LGGQSCAIALRSNGGNLYFDLLVNNKPIIVGSICRNRQRLLVGLNYRGFVGDFVFVDSQGDEQPEYTGLGIRWFLYYLGANE
jgi:hypothetical protein